MKIFYLLAALSLPLLALAAGPESTQEISAPVKSVILYLDGAEVMHNAQLSLNAGRNKVVFTGLSSKLVSKSVQLNVPDGISILSVTDKLNYLSKQEVNPRIKSLKDSADMLNNDHRLLQNDKDAYQAEKQMLTANQYVGGQNTGVALPALKASADFFLERMKEINGEVHKLDRKQQKISEQLTKLNKELTELNAKFNQPSAEVTVLLSATAKTSCTATLKYIVRSAGWAPIYDLRAEDVDKPIELKYRANVFNNSGVDWSEVNLKLSTADPMRTAEQPVLETWYLDYERFTSGTYRQEWADDFEGQRKDTLRLFDGNSDKNGKYSGLLYKDINSVLVSASNVKREGEKVKYEQIQVSELSAEFDIKNPYSIPSDAKPYLVDITTYNLPAIYRHYCAPKVDKDAFLLARITGWEDLNLVQGPANVYYAGTFVGKSYIHTQSTDDTLNLSLGRDGKIVVTRMKQKDLTSTKYIGTNRKEAYAFEIVVKNNRKTPVILELNDQIPVSKQSDISVETIQTSAGELDPISGKLKWNLALQPDETKKIQLAFSIKYPKSRSVTKQKFRTVACPSF